MGSKGGASKEADWLGQSMIPSALTVYNSQRCSLEYFPYIHFPPLAGARVSAIFRE